MDTRQSDVEPIIPPDGWGDDPLSAFFAHVERNVYASFESFELEYRRIGKVDDTYLHLLNDWRDPEDVYVATLAFRAHSAYRAAAELALGGQVPEAFSLIRAVLEHALYANHLVRDGDALAAWQNRHNDDDSRKRSRAIFAMARVWESVRVTDAELADKISALYERAIDNGAHPNVRGVVGGAHFVEAPDATHVRFPYSTAEPVALKFVLKATAQAGFVALLLFQKLLPERTAARNLETRLQALRQLM